MDSFIGIEVVAGRSGFHWFRKNHVAVVFVNNKEIRVAVAGWCDEFSCGIGCNFACDRFAGCKDVVRPYGGIWVGAVFGRGCE